MQYKSMPRYVLNTRLMLCRYLGRPLADLWAGMRWDDDELIVHILIPVTLSQ